MKAAPDVITREVEGGLVLVDVRSGECFHLNHTGGLVWSQLAAGASNENAAEALSSRFEIGRDQAAADVAQLVSQLVAKRLLVQ